MTLVAPITVVFALSAIACGAFWIVTRRLAATRRDLVAAEKDRDALKRTSLVLGQERRVLDLVAHGASLPGIFETLTRAVEELAPGCMCSILLVDAERRCLVQGAAPSLPAGYWALCQGIPVMPDVGCCSSAAFKNEVEIAEDIDTDPRWVSIREIALGYGLRACWSAPIRDSTKDTVLGTFAMYYSAPSKPGELELRMVEAGAELAGKAIQRLRAQEDLIAQVCAKERALAELAGAQERLIDLSRKAGMAEVATGVLHNVGNVLNSVNVSASLMAGKIRESKIENLTAAVNMLQENQGRLDEYVASDLKGSRVLPYLARLSAHFSQERQSLLAELDSLMKNIEHIKEIVATQQNHARISGLNEEVSIEGLIEDAFRMIHPGLERHQIQIRREFAGLPPVVADKHRILQILLNLISNAKRALKERGEGERFLFVRTRTAGEGSVAVEIQDTGVGIAPENLTKIFAQGFTTRRGGHGFGLHSGVLAAQEMGGTLRVQSEGLGHGATFILELPLVTADSRVEARIAVQEKESGVNVIESGAELNRRILIVDDNLAIHEDIVKVLAGTDAEEQALDSEEAALFGTEAVQTVQFEIDSAFQGQEGLEKVRTAISDGHPYAMAFVDIRMPPGWDGVETISHLWKADPGLQVVICTAYSDYSWNEMHRHLGSSDSLLILKKPFDNIEVTQLAHALTRKWTVTRQAEEQTVKLQSELVSRIKTECDLRASQERYLLAARGTNDGIWDWDLESRAIYFAPRWKEMLGFAEDEIDAQPDEWLNRVHPEDNERLLIQLDACMAAGGPDDFISEHRVRHKDCTWRWMLNRAVVLRSPEGSALRIAGSQTDVTRNKAFDSLTALPNRVLFIESVARALEQRKHGTIPSFSVMFVDLDGFKDVNDSLGHSAGDQLLIEVARRVEDTVRADAERRRSTYVLARLGGDEFAALIGDLPGHEAALALAAEIQRVLNEPFVLDGNNIAISASIGIALWNQACATPEEMLQDADTAMYRAKKLGRARAVVFDAAMRAETINRIELTGDLRLALAAGELIVNYQPIFRLSETGSGADGHRLMGFEALARWKHPSRGLVMPREFIPVAEESGLIVPLGDIILREACTRMKRWHDLYPRETPAELSVNLSPSQLRDPNLVQRVAAVLAETGFDPRHLKLEITEAVRIHDFPSVLASVNALKEMGIALEIDDFGTGYSCLSWLPTLRCKSLKIDYSFVTGMMHDVHSLEIIRAIVGLAQSLNMNVIAEGIETKTQLDVLRSMGCWFGQGFYLARPLSSEDAERMIANSAIEESRPAGMDFSALLATR